MTFSSVLEFVFFGWAVGFAFAVSFYYAAKAIFAPKTVLRDTWSGPE